MRSAPLLAEEMVARLRLQPDKAMVRGSDSTDPPRRAWHTWMIECREKGLTVDKQIGRVTKRLRPHLDRIIALSCALAESGSGKIAPKWCDTSTIRKAKKNSVARGQRRKSWPVNISS